MLQPGVYPQHCSRPTSSAAELKVYEALKKSLPKGWYAWHSLRVLVNGGWEGEGDFVIAIPERGMLALEVKGGQISVRDGNWFQNDRPMEKNPRDQGNRFCRLLLDQLRNRSCQPPAYGVGTCFPDTAFEAPPSQGDLQGTVLGEQDLAWMGDALKALIDHAIPKADKSRGNWIEAIHALWGATWTPRPRLGDRVRLDAEDRLRLDAQQLALLSCLEQNRQLLVEGAAGTGKTVLAREVAIREVAAGRKVLVLCFTEALAQWLKAQTACDGLHVAPVKRFSVELLRQAGIDVNVQDNAAFWTEVPLRAAVEALPVTGQQWDSIIIDEGQDLMEEDWQLVFDLSRDRRLWVFRDSEQAFWPDRKFPADQFPARFKLTASYRCPDGILNLALAYLGRPFETKPIQAAIEQGTIGIAACPSPSSVPEKLANEIHKLRSSGLSPSDIAVLSLRGLLAKGILAQHTSLDGQLLVKADSPDLEGHLVGESFLRFKGLERPAILISDVGLVENRLGTRMHIALTRALSVVRIVAAQKALAEDPVLASLGLRY